jgi:hypothetical protein
MTTTGDSGQVLGCLQAIEELAADLIKAVEAARTARANELGLTSLVEELGGLAARLPQEVCALGTAVFREVTRES